MLAYQVALADVVYCEGMGFMVYKPVVYSTADLFTPASIAVEVRMVNKDNKLRNELSSLLLAADEPHLGAGSPPTRYSAI